MQKRLTALQTNRRITYILALLSVLFLSLIVYLTWFELFLGDKIVTNPYNRRLSSREDNTARGKILDRNGVLLAGNKVVNNRQERDYIFGPLYSQIIGYSSKVYGKSLLEAEYNNYLLNINEFSAVFDIKDKLTGSDRTGSNLILTIDNRLQQTASQLLGDRRGAVVALNPKTGEVLAMVSKPDFDPDSQRLSENWRKLVESQNSPFLPRATQGLYAPGSTFKVVISTAAIENGLADRTFNDNGTITIDGRQISNFGGEAHGPLNLKSALAVSSNVVFSQIGVELGFNNLKNIAGRMGIGEDIPFDIPLSESIFPYKSMNKTDMAAVGIGQGKILVTPMQMALTASAIANGGTMMKPLLVSKVVTPEEAILKQQKPSAMGQVMSPSTAAAVKDMMEGVVTGGTGMNAAIQGVRVAGKTGTAENELTGHEKNKEHAWFIGFAPVEDPQIAVAVILEYNGSTGGVAAAPIARDVMAAALGR